MGKLDFDITIPEFVDDLKRNGIECLPIGIDHIARVSRLKFHHRDPFDRLIIAQALAEKMTILSIDPQFEKYKVKVLW